MRLIVPRPLHGWRAFAGEVGVVVLGVLIALACEQVAAAMHDRSSKQQATDAVYRELRQNLSYMKGRMATQACIERRLDEIGGLLERAGEDGLDPKPSWIGQPSEWFNSDEAWQAATGGGEASLFSPEEQQRLGSLYVTSKLFGSAEAREQEAWAQLRGLESWNGPLGPVGRVHFVSALQSARFELWETRVLAEEAFRRAKAAGLTGFEAKAQAEGFSIPHAVCLPIDTTRARALQILSKDSPPWGQPK